MMADFKFPARLDLLHRAARRLAHRGVSGRRRFRGGPVRRRGRWSAFVAPDVEMLLRTLMAWLRGEPRVCSMVPIPSEVDEEARRAHRERVIAGGLIVIASLP